MKSLKRRVAWDVCDSNLNDKVTDHSFKSEERNTSSRVRHHVFTGYAKIAPKPVSLADLLSVPLSIAMGSHRCPEGLFLASGWAMQPRKIRFQKVHPLERKPCSDVSIDEAFGAHRCPTHLFLVTSTVRELRALYARVFPERVQSPENIDLSEATGAYRCPVHLFVASQYKDEYCKRHGKVSLEESQQKRRRNLDASCSGLTIYPEGEPSKQIPANNVMVKKHSIVGRIARRCLKSLRRVSRK